MELSVVSGAPAGRATSASQQPASATTRKPERFRRDDDGRLNEVPGSVNADMPTGAAERRTQPDRGERRGIEARAPGSRARSSGEEKTRWAQKRWDKNCDLKPKVETKLGKILKIMENKTD